MTAAGRQPVFAVVAGGGTAGHVLPALAVGAALVDRGHPPATIHFVGSRRGQEATLVPAAGFGVTLLPGRGVTRRLSAQNAEAVGGLAVASGRALRLLRALRPAVVVSVGGYASLPPALAALALRIPVVLVNADAVPGRANRLVARLAKASAVAVPGTSLPRAVVTGTPIRPEIAGVDRSPAGRRAARRALGLPPERTTVAVVSGSLGARRVNEATVALARAWTGRGELSLHHVVGRRDWPEVAAEAAAAPREEGSLWYQAVEYEDRMPAVLAAADVAVSRAGASFVAELAAVGLPAVLVPLPGAPGDHQTANARVLTDAGAGVLVPDEVCSAERLGQALEGMLGDPGRLAAMEEAAAGAGRPGAAAAVAALVERWALPRPGTPVPEMGLVGDG